MIKLEINAVKGNDRDLYLVTTWKKRNKNLSEFVDAKTFNDLESAQKYLIDRQKELT